MDTIKQDEGKGLFFAMYWGQEVFYHAQPLVNHFVR